MHSQENGNRNIRIVEKIDARRGEVEPAEHVGGHHGRHGHRSHAEEELSRQADQKQHQVHVRREELRARNALCPT